MHQRLHSFYQKKVKLHNIATILRIPVFLLIILESILKQNFLHLKLMLYIFKLSFSQSILKHKMYPIFHNIYQAENVFNIKILINEHQ